MSDLQRELLTYLGISKGHTVQMLFRLGLADQVTHSARRHLSDLIRG